MSKEKAGCREGCRRKIRTIERLALLALCLVTWNKLDDKFDFNQKIIDHFSGNSDFNSSHVEATITSDPQQQIVDPPQESVDSITLLSGRLIEDIVKPGAIVRIVPNDQVPHGDDLDPSENVIELPIGLNDETNIPVPKYGYDPHTHHFTLSWKQDETSGLIEPWLQTHSPTIYVDTDPNSYTIHDPGEVVGCSWVDVRSLQIGQRFTIDGEPFVIKDVFEGQYDEFFPSILERHLPELAGERVYIYSYSSFWLPNPDHYPMYAVAVAIPSR